MHHGPADGPAAQIAARLCAAGVLGPAGPQAMGAVGSECHAPVAASNEVCPASTMSCGASTSLDLGTAV